MKLVVVTAGLTQPSSTRLLADRLTEAVTRRLADPEAPAGPVERAVVAPRVIELRELAVDVANAFVTGFPNSRLRAAIDAVTEADGIIAVTPIFSGSYSGLFKSFFDVLDNTALAGKPVLIAATGGTARHSLALEHAVRPLFAYLRAVVVPTAVYAAAEDWGGGRDAFTDGLGERIERAAEELTDLLLHRAPSARAEQEQVVVPFEEQLAALRPPA
ncbi:oxidoreductase [Nonomuraea turkmeniaca]|uniref:Oxidoreductase n=1 Tax=Nonomuraea turkmeniaca TaxID=103838 RepID=A0A5S4F223_9ACTN|nr:FMN reductase [Nonomuraea turkmeniaca]TMR10032.1 oxidoreductase [Nonomuraea turkmeniaca]